MFNRIMSAILCGILLIFMAGCADRGAPEQENDQTYEITTPVAVTTDRSQQTTEGVTDPSEGPAVTGFGGESILVLRFLPVTRAVQQFAFWEENEEEYILVTQRIDDTAYLSRCKVDREKKTASKVDHVVLEGVGHTESMDVSVYQGQPYVFFTDGANKSNKSAWGTSVCRAKYENGKITERKTLNGMQYLAENGQIVFEGAEPYRINFGLDDEADLFAVYGKIGLGSSSENLEHWVSSYRLSALHEALDRIEPGGSVSLSACGGAFVATTGKSAAKSICANNSFQGMEVAPDGKIYMTGGTVNTKPQLSTFETDGGKIERTDISDIDFIISQRLGTQIFQNKQSFIEIESIKYLKGNLYCIFNSANGMEQNGTEIYLLSLKEKAP